MHMPKSFLKIPDIKHVCNTCTGLMEVGFEEEEIPEAVKTINEIGILDKLEELEIIAQEIAKNEIKEKFKSDKTFFNIMSKKEVAEQMFYEGSSEVLKFFAILRFMEKFPEKKSFILRILGIDETAFHKNKKFFHESLDTKNFVNL